MDFFNRQIAIVSKRGQRKIEGASLMVAGIGGLGTNVCMHLVRAGIGTLHLVDDGLIDAPDLNRQILYASTDLGKSKVLAAKERLDVLGMNTRIFTHNQKIDRKFNLPAGIIGVVDCLDNFPARYILDPLISQKNIFLIHGGIHDLYGQITTIVPGETKSLADIFASSNGQQGKIPVIGPVPAVVASLQALEAIKIICGIKDTLKNKLLFIDLASYHFKIIDLE